MSDKFIVEYTDDEVCIIPQPCIPTQEFMALVKVFGKKGYKWWKPADERGGYVFSKRKD